MNAYPPSVPDRRSEEEQAAEDALVPVVLAAFFGGTAGLAAAGGILGAFACFGLARVLHREYQYRMRRGYYGCERRREEAHRAFEAGIAALKDDPAHWAANYKRVFADYIAELRRIDADFERETGRRPFACAAKKARRRGEAVNPRAEADARRRGGDFLDDETSRGRDWRRNGAPWASPKAVASRRRRREKRMAAWREWARAFAEAARLGKPPPPSPVERRVGGGAPVRRLCERSSSPPPTPEALLAQYDKARGRGPVEEKLRLGSMMLDIEAAVDSSLVRDPSGEIVGRKSGVRGWLDEHCPALSRHYASLMGYRRLADEFRKVHGLRDPHPAARLLEAELPAEAFAPAVREAMERRHAAARRLLASPAARTAKSFAEALARTRRWGIVPRRRTG